jgi:uncharacterized protein YcfJ
MTNADEGCQDESVQRPRLTPWIIGAVVLCAAVGAVLGQQVGDGGGTTVLISVSCGVLGSFLPGAVVWARTRRRGQGRAPGGAA